MDALSNLLQTTAAAASAILMGVCGVCLCVRLTRVMRGEESASGLENETVRARPDGRAMALAAAAAGADGLMIEVHPDPEHALSDGAQSLNPDQFDDLMNRVRKVREAVLS